ncbi:MAG: ABC transporter substrate-binding protein [Deltaproteobacteria bacterium]|nr:ABC transporter substrate-binding protein [Deltaproteobacteria bacterium]
MLIRNLAKVVVGALALILNHVATAHSEDPKAPIKVGAIFSVSGWASIGGQVELNATQLAVEDVNAQGGIAGRKLEVVYEDNHSDLAATVSAFNKLVNKDKVVALLGPNWAEFAEVAAPLAERSKIPMLTASGFSWTLTKGKQFVFTDVPDFNVQVRPLAKYILGQHHKKIALLHSSSTYFDGISSAMRDTLAKAGAPLFKFESVNPKETDYRTLLSRFQKDGVDALILFLQEGGDLAAALRQMKALRYAPAVYSYDLAYDEEISKDRRLADGVVFFSYTGEFSPALRERYLARFSMQPPWTVPKAFDNVFILKSAIEKCGTQPEAIRNCLSQTDHQGSSGRIRYSVNGNILDVGDITELKRVVNGEFASVN